MTDSDELKRRRFLQATGGAAAAAALAGCTGGDDTTTTQSGDGGDGGSGDGGDGGDTTTEDGGDGGSAQGGTLERINSTADTFDPVAAGDTASGRVIEQVFDALMNYPNGETEVVNQLAAGFETNDDFTTYTFNLTDATFHNGDQVTASDIIYSWERLAGSPHSVRSYFILDSLGIAHETDGDGNYSPGSLDVTAVDETTLEINLDTAFASALQMLAYSSFAAVPEGVVGDYTNGDEGTPEEPSDQYVEFAEQNPVGAGAFVFDFWNKGTDMQVTRYDDYHGQVASLDAVHWQVIEDDQAQYQYAINKNADVFGIPTSFFDPNKVKDTSQDEKGRTVGRYGPLDNDEEVQYLKVPEVSTFYFGFNTQNVPKPVRQAVAYVTNQSQIANQVFKGRVKPGYHLTPALIYPGGGNAYDEHVENEYPYSPGETDIQGAVDVMEDAGYGPNNRIEVQFTHYQSQTWSQIAQILQQQLSSAYIDLNIEQAEFSTLLSRGRSGQLEAYTLGWIADWPAPDNFLQLINPENTYTGQTGVLTYTNWGREEETEASRQASEAWERVQNNLQPTDEAEQIRNDAYVQIEEANWEDVVLVNTFHNASEQFAYDNVDIPKFGAMGTSRQMLNTTTKSE